MADLSLFCLVVKHLAKRKPEKLIGFGSCFQSVSIAPPKPTKKRNSTR